MPDEKSAGILLEVSTPPAFGVPQWIWICATMAALAVVVGMIIGDAMAKGSIRREAVRNGAAQYKASDDGAAEFRWNGSTASERSK